MGLMAPIKNLGCHSLPGCHSLFLKFQRGPKTKLASFFSTNTRSPPPNSLTLGKSSCYGETHLWVARKPPPALKMAGTAVVFDFDRTLIDDDSDRWVVTEMGLTEIFNELRTSLPWNSLMDRMMMELHLQGKTSEDIKECLKRTPMHPQVAAAIKSAHALGCDLKIISDANQFFIESILEHHDLLGCFSQIITNPTSVDGDRRLRIFPYHDPDVSSHGCKLCPANMCKGQVIDQFLASAPENGRKRYIYLGDGRNDFCPTLKLVEGDHVMPRKGYPLYDRICSNRNLIKAEIHEWIDGEELAKILLHLISDTPLKKLGAVSPVS